MFQSFLDTLLIATASRYDTINAALEIVSVFMLLPTILQAHKTKLVVGTHWITPAFYCLWNYWNAIFWYPHLGQFWSWVGSVVIAVANTYWVYMVIKYTPTGQFSGFMGFSFVSKAKD